jgi:hypothetical protein
MPQVNITSSISPTSGWHSGNRLAGKGQPHVGTTGRDFHVIESHGLSQAFIERFSVFYAPQENGCWLWTAGVDAYGYGQIARAGGRGPIKAHRAMWMLIHGAITSQEHVLHKCDVTRCVNPAHLFLGNQAINMKDAAAKGRLSVPHRGTARKLSDADVAAIREAPETRGALAALARHYGVSKTSITLIRQGARRRSA